MDPASLEREEALMSFVGFVRAPDGGRAIVGDRFAGSRDSQEFYRSAVPKVFQLGTLLVGSVGSFPVLDEIRRFEPEDSAMAYAKRCRSLFREMADQKEWVSERTIVLVADAREVRPVSYVSRMIHPEYDVPGTAPGWRVVCLGPGRQLGYGAGYALIQEGELDLGKIVRMMAEAAAGWCTAVMTPFDVLTIPPTAEEV
jgi:ATP-dependent protease HslVU (ClpYQ) peptidase subunit